MSALEPDEIARMTLALDVSFAKVKIVVHIACREEFEGQRPASPQTSCSIVEAGVWG